MATQQSPRGARAPAPPSALGPLQRLSLRQLSTGPRGDGRTATVSGEPSRSRPDVRLWCLQGPGRRVRPGLVPHSLASVSLGDGETTEVTLTGSQGPAFLFPRCVYACSPLPRVPRTKGAHGGRRQVPGAVAPGRVQKPRWGRPSLPWGSVSLPLLGLMEPGRPWEGPVSFRSTAWPQQPSGPSRLCRLSY